MRIGLVSCTKSKLDHRAPARELYSPSAVFLGARRFVERSCDRWFVISAKYDLVRPEQEIEPYDQTLNTASRAERRRWSGVVLAALEAELGDLRGTTFEVHAGAAYLDFGLVDGLRARGARVENPVEGLRQGERLHFYKEQETAPRFELSDLEPAGPFDFRWWGPEAGTEHFDRTWEGVAVVDGRSMHVRHGIGRRHAYGRERVHSVTWLDEQPTVEGVASDDYDESRALISAVKRQPLRRVSEARVLRPCATVLPNNAKSLKGPTECACLLVASAPSDRCDCSPFG